MTPNPRTMRPIDDLSDIVAVMLDDGLRSVPIVEDGRLVGIISRDILRCVACRELVTHTASPFAATGARGVRVRVA